MVDVALPVVRIVGSIDREGAGSDGRSPYRQQKAHAGHQPCENQSMSPHSFLLLLSLDCPLVLRERPV